MPRKKTVDEVTEEIRRINPNIEMRDDIPFVNTHTKVGWKCLKCGHKWETTSNNILCQGTGCTVCANHNNGVRARHTIEEIVNLIHERNPDIEVASKEYKGNKKPLELRCGKCGHVWTTTLQNFLHHGCGHCPVCFKRPITLKYSKDEVLNEAKKFKSRGEFCKKSSKMYEFARKHGWLDECTWFTAQPNYAVDNVDSVYVYEFVETHSVYVGRSIRIGVRDRQHRTDGSSIVYRHAKENRVRIPKIKVLYTNISVSEGRKLECDVVEKYKNSGWNILNTGAIGAFSGSVGNLAKKWTKPKIFAVAELCASSKEMRKKYGSAYAAASTMGILGELSLKYLKVLKYSLDEVKKLMATCFTRKEFTKKYSCAYQWLLSHKLIGELDGVLPRVEHLPYDLKTAKEEAAQCSSRKEFLARFPSAYGWLSDRGLLSVLDGMFPKKRVEYSEDIVLRLIKQCKSRHEFCRKFGGAYNWLRNNELCGLLDRHLPKISHQSKYDEKSVRAILESCGCKSRSEFEQKHKGAYDWLYRCNRKDVLDDYFPKVAKRKSKYTLEGANETLEMCGVTSRSDFAIRFKGLYDWMGRHGYMDLLDKYFPKRAARMTKKG